MNALMIVFIVLGMASQGCFIFVERQKKWTLAVILKGLASLFFVALGILCSAKTGYSLYDKLIIAGLIFGLIGDVCLNLRHVLKKVGDKIFLGGVAAFLVGHIIYLIAIIPSATRIVTDIVVGVLVAGILLFYIFKTMEVKIAFKIFGVFYLGAIVIMTTIAIDVAFAAPVLKNLLFAFGAALFTASDIVLIFNTFSGSETFPRRITNLSLYYIAQICIAMTTMFVA